MHITVLMFLWFIKEPCISAQLFNVKQVPEAATSPCLMGGLGLQLQITQ